MTTRRLFIALDLPLSWQAPLATVRRALGALPRPTRCASAKTLHLTVVFLGDVDIARITAIGDAMAQAFGGAEVALHTSAWLRLGPQRDTLALEVKPSPDLLRARTTLLTTLSAQGLALDSRPFRPHITLARRVPHGVVLPALETLSGDAPAVRLIESHLTTHGPVYTPLRTATLTPAPSVQEKGSPR